MRFIKQKYISPVQFAEAVLKLCSSKKRAYCVSHKLRYSNLCWKKRSTFHQQSILWKRFEMCLKNNINYSIHLVYFFVIMVSVLISIIVTSFQLCFEKIINCSVVATFPLINNIIFSSIYGTNALNEHIRCSLFNLKLLYSFIPMLNQHLQISFQKFSGNVAASLDLQKKRERKEVIFFEWKFSIHYDNWAELLKVNNKFKNSPRKKTRNQKNA